MRSISIDARKPEESTFCDLLASLVPLSAPVAHISNFAHHLAAAPGQAKAALVDSHSLLMMHLVKNVMLPRLYASRNLSQWHIRDLRMSSHASALNSLSERRQVPAELRTRHLLQGFQNDAGLPASLRSEDHIERTYSCRRWVAAGFTTLDE